MAKLAGQKGVRIGGRQKGTPNKTSGLLKEAIILAAEQQGDAGEGGLVGYCRFLAREQPKAFAQLMGKVLPLQVQGDLAGKMTLQIVTGVPRASD
jgi:hypothetical protein